MPRNAQVHRSAEEKFAIVIEGLKSGNIAEDLLGYVRSVRAEAASDAVINVVVPETVVGTKTSTKASNCHASGARSAAAAGHAARVVASARSTSMARCGGARLAATAVTIISTQGIWGNTRAPVISPGRCRYLEYTA